MLSILYVLFSMNIYCNIIYLHHFLPFCTFSFGHCVVCSSSIFIYIYSYLAWGGRVTVVWWWYIYTETILFIFSAMICLLFSLFRFMSLFELAVGWKIQGKLYSQLINNLWLEKSKLSVNLKLKCLKRNSGLVWCVFTFGWDSITF